MAKISLTKEIDKVAQEFKPPETSTTSTSPSGNLTISGGGAVGPSNRNTIPGIVGGPVPGSSYGPLSPAGANLGHVPTPNPSHIHSMSPNPQWHDNLNDAFSPPKRTRAIPESKATEFCEMLDKKIALLILARLKTTNEIEKQSLSISIETLEMTRELVKEVFVAQPKDK